MALLEVQQQHLYDHGGDDDRLRVALKTNFLLFLSQMWHVCDTCMCDTRHRDTRQKIPPRKPVTCMTCNFEIVGPMWHACHAKWFSFWQFLTILIFFWQFLYILTIFDNFYIFWWFFTILKTFWQFWIILDNFYLLRQMWQFWELKR